MNQQLAVTLDRGIAIAHLVPNMVKAFWDDMEPMLQKACDTSENEVSTETIRKMLESGMWTVWIASEGDELQGVMVAELIGVEQGVWMNLPFVSSNKNLTALNRMLGVAESYARQEKLLGVKMVSKRKNANALRHRGYEPRYVEYIRRNKEN